MSQYVAPTKEKAMISKFLALFRTNSHEMDKQWRNSVRLGVGFVSLLAVLCELEARRFQFNPR